MITTDRLILRPWLERDLDAYAAICADPVVMEYFPKPLTRDETEAMLMRFNRAFDESGITFWAMIHRETDTCIGHTGLLPHDITEADGPGVEVGWRMGHAHWGQGYATEAARASLSFGFNEKGYDEIVAFVVPDNIRSQAVMLRLGMTRNPDDDFGHPNVKDGDRLKRHQLYRLPKTRWKAQQADSPTL